jgi:hypothetical protein
MSSQTAAALSKRNVEFLVIAILTGIFTALMINYSLDHYRLRIEPYYDDIGYFTDALKRLEVFYDQGLQALWRSLVDSPPHSPWSTLLGMFAFAILGISNVAPYACNSILIFIFLLVIFNIEVTATLACKLCVSLFALSTPLAALAIMDFRPDFATNLFLAAGASILLFQTAQTAFLKPWIRAALVLFFSGALLAKPTTVLATSFLILFAQGLHVLSAMRDRDLCWARIRDMFLTSSFIALFTGWYYVVNFQHIYGYISDNLVRSIHKDLNNIVSMKDRLTFFLTGVGGIQLDLHYFYIIGLVTLSVVLAAFQKEREVILIHLKALLWTVVAYLGTSLAGIANHFIGLNFQIMLLLSGCYSFYHLIRVAGTGFTGHAAKVIAVAVVVMAITSGFPPKHGRYAPGDAEDVMVINDQLVARLSALTAGKPPLTAAFLTIGLNANPPTFDWLMTRNHIRVNIQANMFATNLKDIVTLIDSSDIIITSDLNVPSLITNTGSSAAYPYVAFLPEAMNYLNMRDRFQLDAKIRTAKGGFYYVYKKLEANP